MVSLRLLLFPLVATVGVLGSGCASYRPQPLDGQTELDQLRLRDLREFVVEYAAPGQGVDPNAAKFDPADGLDEAELVAVALTVNPELRAKRAEVGEARASLLAAGQWPNPEVGFRPRWGIDGSSGFSLDADALFQLLRPGERDAQQNAARARVEEARHDVVADEYRVVNEVRSKRLDVLAAERTVTLLGEAVELRERVLELVRRQRRGGEGTELEVSATELDAAEARRDLRKARVELSTALLELNRLLGLPPEYQLKLSGFGEPLPVTVYEDIDDQNLDRRVLAGRVELSAKEAQYRRAEEELRLAVIRQYPRLGIGPSFEKEIEGTKGLGLGLSLELPLLNQNQGEIAERHAARERVRAEYVALLARLRADAFAARAALRAAKREVETQETEIVPLLRRNQELFEGAYRAREINVLAWITAQQRAVTARREHLDALVRYRRALIQLETAAGLPLSRSTTRASTTQPTTNDSTNRRSS